MAKQGNENRCSTRFFSLDFVGLRNGEEKEHDLALFPVTFGFLGSETKVEEDKKAKEETCNYGGGRWRGTIHALFCPVFRVFCFNGSSGLRMKKAE